MFMDNIKTFASYCLVGDAYEAMEIFGAILQTLMVQLVLSVLAFATYQVLLAAYTLGEVVADRKITSDLRKVFIAINVGSTVCSLFATGIVLAINKMWPRGLVHFMWAMVVLLLLIFFWYYFLLLIRTAQSTAESLGVTRAQNSLRKPYLTTVLLCVILVALFVRGAEDLLDMQALHHESSRYSYVPVSELLFLVACTASTYFAWLPLKKKADVRKIRKSRLSGQSRTRRHLRSPNTMKPRVLVPSPTAAREMGRKSAADADHHSKTPYAFERKSSEVPIITEL
jgi:uncharacterized membrane protein